MLHLNTTRLCMEWRMVSSTLLCRQRYTIWWIDGKTRLGERKIEWKVNFFFYSPIHIRKNENWTRAVARFVDVTAQREMKIWFSGSSIQLSLYSHTFITCTNGRSAVSADRFLPWSLIFIHCWGCCYCWSATNSSFMMRQRRAPPALLDKSLFEIHTVMFSQWETLWRHSFTIFFR